MNGSMKYVLVTLGACLLAPTALADRGGYWRPHGHGYFGVYLGSPWIYPVPYPVYSAPIVVTPAPPPVYIEQTLPAPALEPGYWYYCAETREYYPHIKECPGPWLKVAPEPAK